MTIIVFEDSLVTQLYPLTLGRAAYSIQCGGMCLADWLEQQDVSVRGIVRPHLQAWQAGEFPRFAGQPDTKQLSQQANPRLFINARLVPCQSTFAYLRQLVLRQTPCVIRQGETVIAALTPADCTSSTLTTPNDVQSFLSSEAVDALPIVEQPMPLLSYPSDLIHQHMNCFAENLNHRIEQGDYHEVQDGVYVARNAEVSRMIDVDTSNGPVVVDAGASIKAFSCLRGPTYLAAMSRVNEHAVIRPGVHVGTMSKVGGEIEASVIEAFTNKQHLGYLGHSYLGRWVNLGAGTSNSNLKNTYGSIRIEVEGRRVDTGLQFMGCVVGDYTKTAINTSIFTGKVIGAGSMVYGFVTTDVPSFVNYARTFGEITEQSPQVVATTQKRVFLRRGIEQQPWHVQLLEDMYEIASEGRQLADKPVSL